MISKPRFVHILSTLSNLSLLSMIFNLRMTFFDVLAAFKACTNVLCLLLRGLATFSTASEGRTKSLAECLQLICGIYFSSCLFCWITFLRRKLRNSITRNVTHPFDPIVDPSNECIAIILIFID
jgi:hypothetical protein